ncbi:MAG: hypothetical protein V1866_03190 [archaeon]
MSDKLYERLRREFPPTPIGYKRLSVYPPSDEERPTWIERIHLNFSEREFLDMKEPFVTLEDIGMLAQKIFNDINFDFQSVQNGDDKGHFIFFLPKGINKYVASYSGHYIKVDEPLRYARMTFSTGNRGCIELHPRQRDKYFQFAKQAHALYLKRLLHYPR